MLWTRPGSGWIGVIPPAVLYFRLPAYLSQKVEGDRLQALYEVSGRPPCSSQDRGGTWAAVERTRRMFDAEHAEIVLFPEEPDTMPLVTTSQVDHETVVMKRSGAVEESLKRLASTGFGGR